MAIQWGRLIDDFTQVDAAAGQGFDFAQLTSELDAEHAPQGVLPFVACAVPLSVEVRVTQRGFNHYAWMAHLREAVSRLATRGCRKLLWSDGRSRVLPVEGERGDLKEQVFLFLSMLSDLASRHGIRVLVEPLGPRRTNFLNAPGEVADLLGRVRKENLSSMISLRELEPMELPMNRIADYRQLIQYVQLDNPRHLEGARICPRPTDGYDYRPFLRALKEMGYGGEIGLPADADADGLGYCRELWERV